MNADTARWTLEGDDAGDFMLRRTSGDERYAQDSVSSPDYENAADANTDNVYMVTLKATRQTVTWTPTT